MLQDDSEKPTRLLGPTVDPMFYEDERALTEYVWKHYQHLMTPFELRVGLYSVPILSDMENEKYAEFTNIAKRLTAMSKTKT